jgi:hypothetical protein
LASYRARRVNGTPMPMIRFDFMAAQAIKGAPGAAQQGAGEALAQKALNALCDRALAALEVAVMTAHDAIHFDVGKQAR